MRALYRIAAAKLAAALLAQATASALVFVSPINPSDFYPQRAKDRGIEGTTKIRCRLSESGKLIECIVLSESPAAYGFGAAAIRMVTRSRVDIKASGLTHLIGTLVKIPVDFVLSEDAPPPPASDPVIASDDGGTPPPPEGEYEDHADGQQFAEDAELTPEDRAARQVHSTTPADTGCPEQSGCLAAN